MVRGRAGLCSSKLRPRFSTERFADVSFIFPVSRKVVHPPLALVAAKFLRFGEPLALDAVHLNAYFPLGPAYASVFAICYSRRWSRLAAGTG